ncbi:MAG TPA: hemerythrin domain-containing protein [Ornithinibacter sp.]|nr:hemerythrin domain-containing protein [Ornithinibacter sp.]
MPTMSMNKVIHAAVRRDLDRFAVGLDDFREGDAARAAALARAWANFDAMLTDHHEGEHAIAWPHLERAGVPRELLDRMDAEHEVMAEGMAGARTAMAELASRPTREQAAAARSAMETLRTATVQHLDHEESEIEAFYLANDEHPEIRAMAQEFRKQSPQVAGRFLAWLTDGIAPEARSAIPVPGPVLAVLTGIFGRGYRREVAPVWR